MKKILILALAVLMCFVTLMGNVACSTKLETIDKTKTQLYVGNYDGGVGKVWLENIKARFEEEYKDVPFEEGKKGVQIIIKSDKTTMVPETLVNMIATITEEVFFTAGGNFYDLYNTGKLLDLTNIVTKNLPGENKTIEEKMYKDYKDYYTVDGKYYCLPHYEYGNGIIYDVDYFDDNLLYFSSIDNNSFVKNLKNKSVGPDNTPGTIDDGLPATYEQFYALCERIQYYSDVPMTWSGEYKDYYSFLLLDSLFADYEGKEGYMLNYTFDGTASTIIADNGISANNEITFKQPFKITRSNGYELRQQAGKYFGLDFIDKIIEGSAENGSFLYSESFKKTNSHLDAQENFIKGTREGNKIAMLVEGSWWEIEAAAGGKFDDQTGSMARENRNFAFMPLPKATLDKVGEKTIVVNAGGGSCFARNNVSDAKKSLIEEFITFCYSEKSLQEFHVTTGIPLALKYELTDAQLEGLSPYQKSLYDYFNDYAEVVFPNTKEEMVLRNYSTLGPQKLDAWTTTVGGEDYKMPCNTFKNHTVSAKEYFEGMKMTESAWINAYGSSFN